jgi:Ca2+-binding RTX toxin-like protein
MPGKHRNGLRGRGAAAGVTLLATLVAALGGGLLASAHSVRGHRIIGTRHADHLVGTKGADVIKGGGGYDTIKGKGGADVIRARDGHLDYIDCGTGRDVAYVDRAADGVFDCERIVEPTSGQKRSAR